jgi:hypothetical protein
VLSLRTASTLLRASDGLARLDRIASELGFRGRREVLTPSCRSQLGLPRSVRRAHLIPGEGALRSLAIEFNEALSAREVLQRVAATLSRRTPHCLWLVLGATQQSSTTIIGTWLPGRSGCRVRALVVDREHVYGSDAETLCALAAATEGPDVLVHTRWQEVLGRDSLTRRFHAALADCVRALGDDFPRGTDRVTRAELALLHTSRLLFLSFVQGNGWLNGDHAFLQNAFERALADGGNAHRRLLEPLFFGTLNTRVRDRGPAARAFGRIPYLNGGLFARTHAERIDRSARMSDAVLGSLFTDLLSRYRFTPREDEESWSEAAIDPVILGRAFESLMDPGARRSSGTFYTPAVVVEHATRSALRAALGERIVPVLKGEAPAVNEARALLDEMRSLRVLDPACGSGAFLVHALRVLADARVALGAESRQDARAAVLAANIFGVDCNPTAVWLCQLRLWLSLAIEHETDDPLSVPPLPNLDRNIRVGDSLSGSSFEGFEVGRTSTKLTQLRVRYARAQGPRKRTLARALDLEERRAAIALLDARVRSSIDRRRELLTAVRSRDLFGERRAGKEAGDSLRRLRAQCRSLRAEISRLCSGGALPFSFAVHFADVSDSGGFDVIVGNPPWVRPHKLAPEVRAALRSHFAVYRPASQASSRFGGQVDLAAPFVERSLSLLREGGALALLLPAKLWTSAAGGGLRAHLAERAVISSIEDFTSSSPLFDAATYPSLLTAQRTVHENLPADPLRVAIHRRSGAVAWDASLTTIRASSDSSAPWLLVPPGVRAAFDRVAAAGVPLASSLLGQPRLGVKTGCNDAFVVTARSRGPELVEIGNGERHGWIEAGLLRPVLRGELVRPWKAPAVSSEWVIWTHDRAGRPLAELPQHAHCWLRPWRATLMRRADARDAVRWWTLFRTPAARSDRHRVVWCDIGRVPRALVLEPCDPTVPLNTCYVTFAGEVDAWALAALLNSPLAGAWLNVLAEPARGGYKRYFGGTVGQLPLPAKSERFRALAEMGTKAARDGGVSPVELLHAVADAYELRLRDLAPLLEWHDV